MFYTEANEVRRVSNRTVSGRGVAHGEHAHLGRHAVEIPDPLRDRMVGQRTPESRGDANPRRRLIGKWSQIRIEKDFVD